MIYIILAVVILIIGKFIYSNYFTNNKEKDWDENKKKNPHKAKLIENKGGYKTNLNSILRTDGYYISKFSVDSEHVHFLLIFTKNGFVAFSELDDYEEYIRENGNEAFRQAVIDGNHIKEIELSESMGKYVIRNGEVTATFFDPNDFANKDSAVPNCYKEWEGTIIHNGLILNYSTSYYSNALKDYTRETKLKDLKFKFIEIKS